MVVGTRMERTVLGTDGGRRARLVLGWVTVIGLLFLTSQKYE